MSLLNLKLWYTLWRRLHTHTQMHAHAHANAHAHTPLHWPKARHLHTLGGRGRRQQLSGSTDSWTDSVLGQTPLAAGILNVLGTPPWASFGLQTQHSSSSIAEDRGFRNKTYKHHWDLNHSKMQWTMLWETFIHWSHDHIVSILTLAHTKKIFGCSKIVVLYGKCRICLLCVSLESSEGSPIYT